MIGTVLLFICLGIECCFIVFGLLKKSNLKREKSFTRISVFIVFVLLVVTGVVHYGFQWVSVCLLFVIQAIIASIRILRKKINQDQKIYKTFVHGVGRSLLLFVLFIPTLLFPQYKPIEPTGSLKVGTVSYTLTDESRDEPFTKEKDARNLTIQFWYPSDKKGNLLDDGNRYPLVIFSHGAFGFRLSNYSTYQELASHGYIVASIDHTYHAFMTSQTDGKNLIVNTEFLNQVTQAQNGKISGEELYHLEQEWLNLRTADMAFVLNHIKTEVNKSNVSGVYAHIDLEHIGVMGHSLGGATAAKIARDVEEVDAVIVIDGTMMGEIIGFENGKALITEEPFPKPLLNIYNESHYEEMITTDDYPNKIAHQHALDAYQVVVHGSGHMSFTDLAIISPILSNVLETSDGVDVDPKTCITTTNTIILEFFDYYLKGKGEEIPNERVY